MFYFHHKEGKVAGELILERERENKKAFTLIELLIVVVIIGVFTVALMPRLNGYLARTRDVKRQSDLRNIATAIERYKTKYGKNPTPKTDRDEYFYKASALSHLLKDYISSIPTDPNKNNLVLILSVYYHYKQNPLNGNDNPWNLGLPNGRLPRGEYQYQLTSSEKAFLVAKVETPEYANFVLSNPLGLPTTPGAGFQHRSYDGQTPRSGNEVFFCVAIEKTGLGGEVPASSTNVNCKYSSEDQLYYIVKIE